MAKTKRTVEEAEVVAAAAANSDSKLITQSKLSHFATGFWAKIKGRYDEAFKGATLTQSTDPNKKLTFTRVSNTNPLEIDLRDYARLTDKSEFKKDVSADNVAILSNRHIGTSFGTTSRNRSLGFRQLTVNSFSDRYVDHIRIYMPTNIATGTNSTWFVWAIKKGANGKDGDTVAEVICNNRTFTVSTVNENSTERFVKIPINKSFENDTYFIVRCTTHDVEVVNGIKDGYKEDVVNMNSGQPPTTPGELINWNNGSNEKGNTVVMYLFGRESIGTLSLKLNKLNSDSGLYVKHSETTAVGGNGEGGKVVKLDSDGKLNKNMLPSIAINEYFTVTEFTNDALQNLGHFENGDVVVVSNGGVVTKRYLCVDKEHNANNLIKGFVELNSKEGMVQSVNGKNGAVTLALEAAADELKLKITGGEGAADVTETSVPIVTNEDIDSIINGLRD